MELAGKVVVVTGGGSGIGAALCRRFALEGAALVVVADLDDAAADAVAEAVGGRAVRLDVSRSTDVEHLVRQVEEAYGRIDLFCSNAGIFGGGGLEASPDVWQRTWEVNVLAHVHAARAVLPGMLARGEGYLLATASAAGLLTNIGNAPYSVTKHAAVALAEWLAVTYGDRGIKVSCLCPQAVRTPMLVHGLEEGDDAVATVLTAGELLEADDVADAVVAGLRDERFLVLPHPEVGEYHRRKADDPDRWIRGMQRVRSRL